ncbi:MAG: hypothetical protein P4M15_07155 [Alphaproteobacteria bacterium]|nr:hypothetical protein [Alphaproteobacteria bacterium]
MKLAVRFDHTTPLAVALKFEQFPDQLREELLATVSALATEAFGQVAARVPRRTGRLASQERIAIKDEPTRVSARVDFDGGDAQGGDFAKGGALEYGSKGEPVDYAGYTRQQDHVWNKRLSAPIDVLIGALTRTPTIAPQNFVRSVAASMQSEAVERLNAVADRAIEKLNND